MFFADLIFALINGSILPCLLAHAMMQVILPLSLVFSAICMCVGPHTAHEVILPVPDVNISIGMEESAVTVLFVSKPVSLIHAAILHDCLTSALLFFAHPFASVLHPLIVSLDLSLWSGLCMVPCRFQHLFALLILVSERSQFFHESLHCITPERSLAIFDCSIIAEKFLEEVWVLLDLFVSLSGKITPDLGLNLDQTQNLVVDSLTFDTWSSGVEVVARHVSSATPSASLSHYNLFMLFFCRI